jgi:hypothetical protein
MLAYPPRSGRRFEVTVPGEASGNQSAQLQISANPATSICEAS